MTTDTNGAGGLPELPTQVADVYFTDDDFDLSFMPGMPCNNGPLYTADQMRAYGELCRATREGDGEVQHVPLPVRSSFAAADDYTEGERAGFANGWNACAAHVRALSRVAVQEGK